MNIQSFTRTYKNRTVLSFPGFSFQMGKIYAVIGANGCGKSTFAKVLAGTLPSDQKQPVILDAPVSVGYLPQKPYAFHMSLLQNLMLNASDRRAVSLEKAQYLMEKLRINHLSNKKASSFSGGETARMALARLMMKDYEVLILDEPCAAMDIPSTLITEELLREYCKRTGSAIILITHSLQQAKRTADEVLFLHQGTLWESGTADQLFHHAEKTETQEFLDFYR